MNNDLDFNYHLSIVSRYVLSLWLLHSRYEPCNPLHALIDRECLFEHSPPQCENLFKLFQPWM
jgi:hypothetical protein